MVPPDKERGAALLTVLLLVAVIAVLAAHGLDRLGNATRLAGNSQELSQARAYLVAAEGLGIDTASSIQRATPGRTTRAPGWNGRTIALPVPVGTVSATMHDGGNCFNVNSVVEGREGEFAPRQVGIDQFTRLLVTQQVQPGDARDIANSLADWIDSDQSESRGGAEDSYYRGLEDPYYTADNIISDLSELRLIKGMTAETYDRILPYLCALPVAELSPINVNTLLPEDAVLLAILGREAPDIPALANFIGNIPETGFASLPDFWGLPLPASLGASEEVQRQTKLVTRWFRLDIVVETPSALVEETALIDAGRDPPRLVSRSWTSGL